MVPLASASGYIVISLGVVSAIVLVIVLLRLEDRGEADDRTDERS